MSARRLAGFGLAILAVTFALLAANALAAEPKTTLGDVEDEVMCVVCGVPLNIAEAPQADRERAFIQERIDQGKTKDQIKQELEDEYGEQVLADPTGGGIAIATWLVPLLLLLAAITALIVVVPRWRRRRAAAAAAPSEPEPSPLEDVDRRRLDEDLARYR